MGGMLDLKDCKLGLSVALPSNLDHGLKTWGVPYNYINYVDAQRWKGFCSLMHYLTFLVVLFTVIPWESNGVRRPGYNGEFPKSCRYLPRNSPNG
ncbi:unnamed protein product, partial [Porites lobata]